ncbi:MAG: polyribonucleotide nucleotidyltransferase [Polyangiaceae bacterium]|nr:polyribonucleotide nucleotidyltransferase [Polyangiaceae bacterium]
MFVRESVRVGNAVLTLETGRLAKQASGAVMVTMGETVLLVTAVSSGEERPGIDFFPLTCDYIEKTYAAGKIPGGFFKREARPRDYEVLTSRLMDRPVRPLFPEGFKSETQIIATLWSFDKEHPSEVLALTGASAALHISNIPWDGPIAGIRVGRVDGEFVAFPTYQQLEHSDMDITVACSRDAIVMVEGATDEVSEQALIDALLFAHEAAQPIIDLIDKLRESVGKPKFSFEAVHLPEDMRRRLYELCVDGVRACLQIGEKQPRYAQYRVVRKAAFAKLTEEFGADAMAKWDKLLKESFEDDVKGREMRRMIIEQGRRIGGRDTRTIRDICCEVGVLPRTHGSAVFQRGETQALVTVTLGTSSDEQKVDTLMGDTFKSFLLHYNFPPFCTGEVKRIGSVGRREVGHGNLAERALHGMIPDHARFPYTTRIVSEVLESNGSSSMATVCGGTLSLMDAGVPIKHPVAGIAMGLIKEGDSVAVLSDILGDEDHMGDMDFKVCGTARGITAIQMDIKVKGLSREILTSALEQAREGRLHILGKMIEALPVHRDSMSKWAPRITSIKVKPDQIRVIIGSGGKTIKGIIDQTGAQINVEDDGTVNVASADEDAVRRALQIIEGLVAEPEVGVVYKGTVKRITDFGAFVEILPNTDGLLHISEISMERVERVEDVLKEGETIEVKVMNVDRDGKVKLSRKVLLPGGDVEAARAEAARARPERVGPPPRDRAAVPRESPPRDRVRVAPPRDRVPREVGSEVRERPLRTRLSREVRVEPVAEVKVEVDLEEDGAITTRRRGDGGGA